MARRRKRSFGVLTHRGAGQYSGRSRSRKVNVQVVIFREKGASRKGQYCAWARLARKAIPRGDAPASSRVGKTVCGPTPTVVMKRALRVFISDKWTR